MLDNRTMHRRHTLRVSGIDCAACAQSIERGVGELEGVVTCALNPQSGLLVVEGDVSEAAVAARVRALGYDVSHAEASPSAPTSFAGAFGFVR